MRQTCQQLLCPHCMEVAPSPPQCTMDYRAGGIAQIATGNIVGRIWETATGKTGHWLFFHLTTKTNNGITFILASQVCDNNILGVMQLSLQQISQLAMEAITTGYSPWQ